MVVWNSSAQSHGENNRVGDGLSVGWKMVSPGVIVVRCRHTGG